MCREKNTDISSKDSGHISSGPHRQDSLSNTTNTVCPGKEKVDERQFQEGKCEDKNGFKVINNLDFRRGNKPSEKTDLKDVDGEKMGKDSEKLERTPREAGSGNSVYTLEEVSYHCGPDSCWIVLWDQVYDVTNFIKEHPGGEDIIYEHGGMDATSVFSDVRHSSDALIMMVPYRIGVLVESERIFKRKKFDSVSS